MYANQLINEAEVQKTWGPVIEESTGITEKSKLAKWVNDRLPVVSFVENVLMQIFILYFQSFLCIFACNLVLSKHIKMLSIY